MSLLYEKQKLIERNKKRELVQLKQDRLFFEGVIHRQRIDYWKQINVGILAGIALFLLFSTSMIVHKRVKSRSPAIPLETQPQLALSSAKPLLASDIQQLVGKSLFSPSAELVSPTYLTSRGYTAIQHRQLPLQRSDKFSPVSISTTTPRPPLSFPAVRVKLGVSPQQILKYQFEATHSLAFTSHKPSLLASSAYSRPRTDPALFLEVIQDQLQLALPDTELMVISPSYSNKTLSTTAGKYTPAHISFVEKKLAPIEKQTPVVVDPNNRSNGTIENSF